jgi:Nucleoside transporter
LPLFAALIHKWDHPSPPLYYIFTLASVFLSSFASALVEYGSFGFAGRFGPLYTQAIMAGQAFSGVFPPIISIICVSSLLSRSSIATEIFFACSAVLTGMALIGFLLLKQLGSNHSIFGTSSVENTGLDFSIRKAETALEILKGMAYFP